MNIENIKMLLALCVVFFTCVYTVAKRNTTISDSFHLVFILAVFCFVSGMYTGIRAGIATKEPVECAVKGSPMVHGKKLNVIDLTLVCDGHIVEVKDQQIGYNFSESGVKRNGTPAPKTAINP